MVRKFGSSFVLAALGFLAACASSGSTESGQKFGVQIGMSLDDASVILHRQGFQPSPLITNELPSCGYRARKRGEELNSFWGPRQPELCLFTVSRRVVAIAWEYTVP